MARAISNSAERAFLEAYLGGMKATQSRFGAYLRGAGQSEEYSSGVSILITILLGGGCVGRGCGDNPGKDADEEDDGGDGEHADPPGDDTGTNSSPEGFTGGDCPPGVDC